MIPGKAVFVTMHFLLKRQKAVFARALTDYSAIILSVSSFIISLGALISPSDMLCCIRTVKARTLADAQLFRNKGFLLSFMNMKHALTWLYLT